MTVAHTGSLSLGSNPGGQGERGGGMTEVAIRFKVGDITKEKTDGLVCSGNVQLNMSGGVNGALLQAGGEAIGNPHSKRYQFPHAKGGHCWVKN